MLFGYFLRLHRNTEPGCKERVNGDIALPGNPISEPRDVTCHMGSHSVTCHQTQTAIGDSSCINYAYLWTVAMRIS